MVPEDSASAVAEWHWICRCDEPTRCEFPAWAASSHPRLVLAPSEFAVDDEAPAAYDADATGAATAKGRTWRQTC